MLRVAGSERVDGRDRVRDVANQRNTVLIDKSGGTAGRQDSTESGAAGERSPASRRCDSRLHPAPEPTFPLQKVLAATFGPESLAAYKAGLSCDIFSI